MSNITTTFRVSTKGAIMSPRVKGQASKLLKPGTVITPSVAGEHGLTREMLREHYESGYLVVHTPTPDDPFTPAPGYEAKPALPGKGEGEEKTLPASAAVTTAGKDGQITTSVAPSEKPVVVQPEIAEALDKTAEPVRQVTSKWVLDPAKLEGKTLDELNVMIAERDESVDPCQSIEDAIKLLSLDFEPERSNVATS